MKDVYYNPGCALLIYKEELANKMYEYLKSKDNSIKLHTICCHHDPQVEDESLIINTCAGCDRRFSTLYDNIETISVWEMLAEDDDFLFPDHTGLTLSIHDACPIRGKNQVHNAIRKLLDKMNITVIENEFSKGKSICCGDNLYPHVSIEKVQEHMKKRAESMPCDEVCVYCVSCIKSMHIGGKKPRYMVDLLFNETTEVGEYDTVKWHDMVNEFIKEH
ncbi:Fe-S oxidoreductase [Bacilli bacterium PM5-3]|nr:Fe-S oxidoreductase [Bacilli bacterium PM5-3]